MQFKKYLGKIKILSVLFISMNCFSQENCENLLEIYRNTIDTTNRSVYAIVETMPDMTETNNVMNFFRQNIKFSEGTGCFPIYIYYGFVVERDSSITNVMICPQFVFCNDSVGEQVERQKIIDLFTNELLNKKSSVGLLQGKKVAVYTQGRIHFDPQ
jgi:hypothetical protein